MKRKYDTIVPENRWHNPVNIYTVISSVVTQRWALMSSDIWQQACTHRWQWFHRLLDSGLVEHQVLMSTQIDVCHRAQLTEYV